jgi:enediyne biosynthesis protein E3
MKISPITNRWLLGIRARETSFARRGFRAGDPEAQRRLERAGELFLAGYHAALESSGDGELENRLRALEPEFQGFAFEGAAMSLMLLDRLMPWKRARWPGFLAGAGEPHIYMMHVGAGWAFARLPWVRPRIERALAGMDGLMRWLALDGYGFHEGYFSWPKSVGERRVPRGLSAYGLRVFDQGLGRSLWFINGAMADRVAETIACFPAPRRADLWSGVGLACAYAGGASNAAIARLAEAAHEYRAELAQGAAFAAKARLRAGIAAEHTEAACRLICDMPAREAAAVTDDALKNLPADGEQPAFEIWRRRIQREFAGVRR